MSQSPVVSRETSTCCSIHEIVLETGHQRRLLPDRSMPDVQAMTVVGDVIYTAHGSAFGLRGSGSLCSLNVKTGV